MKLRGCTKGQLNCKLTRNLQTQVRMDYYLNRPGRNEVAAVSSLPTVVTSTRGQTSPYPCKTRIRGRSFSYVNNTCTTRAFSLRRRIPPRTTRGHREGSSCVTGIDSLSPFGSRSTVRSAPTVFTRWKLTERPREKNKIHT